MQNASMTDRLKEKRGEERWDDGQLSTIEQGMIGQPEKDSKNIHPF